MNCTVDSLPVSTAPLLTEYTTRPPSLTETSACGDRAVQG